MWRAAGHVRQPLRPAVTDGSNAVAAWALLDWWGDMWIGWHPQRHVYECGMARHQAKEGVKQASTQSSAFLAREARRGVVLERVQDIIDTAATSRIG